MRPIHVPIVLLASLASAGCAAAPIRTVIGRPPAECRTLGEVTGFRGEPATRNDRGEGRQILEAAERLGANALKYRSAVDEEYRATAYACAAQARVRTVRFQQPARVVRSEPPGVCEEVGLVESSLARSQVELRELLARSAAMIGGNVLRIDSTGPRAVPDPRGGAPLQRHAGIGTAFFCPDG